MAITVDEHSLMDTCVYARKSTNKLAQKESVPNQISICAGEAPKLKLRIVETKKDSATGTDDINRPEIKEMIQEAIAGKYKCVMMKGISRFFRDVEKGLALIKQLDRHDIRFVTIEEGFDSYKDRTGNGKLDTSKITMYLMFAEMESKKTADRVKYTQRIKAERGEWNQASSPPFGYVYDPETKKLKVGEYANVETVRLIFSLYAEGQGMRMIQHYLNGDNPDERKYPSPGGGLWNQYTIGQMLKNPVYIGTVVYNKRSKKERYYKQPAMLGKTEEDVWVGAEFNDPSEWIICESAHDAIIKKELFDYVQEMMNSKGVRKGVRNNTSLLAGIAVCGSCGKGLTFKRGNLDPVTGWKKSKDNYYCINYIQFGKRICTSHHIGAKELEDLVITDLQELRNDRKLLDKMFAENKATALGGSAKSEREVIKAEKELKQISDKIDKLLEKNLTGKMSDEQFDLMNAKYKTDLEEVNARVRALKERTKQTESIDEQEKLFKNKIEQLAQIEEMNKEQLRLLLMALIDKVVLFPSGDVKIVYRFKK